MRESRGALAPVVKAPRLSRMRLTVIDLTLRTADYRGMSSRVPTIRRIFFRSLGRWCGLLRKIVYGVVGLLVVLIALAIALDFNGSLRHSSLGLQIGLHKTVHASKLRHR